MHVVGTQNKAPQLWVSYLEEITSLGLEHGVLIGNIDELQVILTLSIGDVGKIWVSLLAVFTDSERIILIILLEKLLGVIVTSKVSYGNVDH